jgi:serine/threonine protein kinase
MTQQSRIIGQILGHYRLVRLLGSGGFADVYLGEHIHLHTQAAVKILHTRLADTDVEEFRREAQTVALLQHPSIVRVLDFGVEDTIPYLVMDYAPNGSLRHRYPRGTVAPVAEVTPILMQVASALQHAHNHRLIHRDIKPENMLLGRNHEVLLSDFGIALVTQSSHSQSTQNIAGTIAYMAPEQIQAHPRPASDQYALGIVVYEWLSGERPFQGSYTEIAIKHTMMPPPSLLEQIPHLPVAIEQVVMKALQKDPQQRFESVLAFAQAFAQAAKSVMQLQQYPTIAQSPSASSSQAVSATLPAQFMRRGQMPTQDRGWGDWREAQSLQQQASATQSAQPMLPTLTPPNATMASASTTDLQPSSFVLPSQSVISTAPNNNLYPPPPPLTPSMPSYSTFMTPAQSQFAGPALQPPMGLVGGGSAQGPTPEGPTAQPQQPHKQSAISRRSFIGGGIAGLVIAGGVGAWVYIQHLRGGSLPTIPAPTGGGSIPNLGIKTDTPLLTYSGHHESVFRISWSPDGNYIASGSEIGNCHIWTADKGDLKFSIHTTIQPPISDDFVQSIVWSRHNPPRVAIGFVDGTLQILDINNRTRLGSLDDGYKTYGILSWSPDEKYLAVCANITANGVAIYEVATWKIVYTYQDHTDSLRAVAWSPDGNYVASGSDDTTIRIWEPFNGRTHLVYKEHTKEIETICWSSDSAKIVSTAQDYVVRMWERETGRTLHTHEYPSRAPMGKIAWSHNNQLVAAYPGTASVDILDAQLTVKQTIQTGVVYDLSWSPDDTRLVTANYDNVAQIWQINS